LGLIATVIATMTFQMILNPLGGVMSIKDGTYLKNIHRDESNKILYDIIYRCILVEKYGQSMIYQ